jgi:hypothetical protein
MDFTSQRIGVPTLHDPLSDRSDRDPLIEPRLVLVLRVPVMV